MPDLDIEVENYLINSMCSAVIDVRDIVGLGIFLNPASLIKISRGLYALYVSGGSCQNKAQSFGAYSDYSNKEYYKPVKKAEKPYFTKPIKYQGVTMITAAYPVICNNEFQGVIVADIDVNWKFSKITTSSEDYKTLYAGILTDDFPSI